MNTVILQGRLARDVEVRGTKTNKKVAIFSVATNETYIKDDQIRESVSFVNCVAWERQCDNVEGGLKGDKVSVIGKIATRSYDKDGEKRYTTEVIATTAMLESNKSSNFDSFDDAEEIPF